MVWLKGPYRGSGVGREVLAQVSTGSGGNAILRKPSGLHGLDIAHNLQSRLGIQPQLSQEAVPRKHHGSGSTFSVISRSESRDRPPQTQPHALIQMHRPTGFSSARSIWTSGKPTTAIAIVPRQRAEADPNDRLFALRTVQNVVSRRYLFYVNPHK